MLNFLNEANWWCLLLLLILAFLLGWLLSRWIYKNKYKDDLEKCRKQKATLEKLSASLDNSTEVNSHDQDTFDTNKEAPQLNFNSFGKADASEKDDLKLISGIGPFIEEKLNGIGIYTFDQISRFTKEDIETVTELIKFFPGRIERDFWTDQAEKLKNS